MLETLAGLGGHLLASQAADRAVRGSWLFLDASRNHLPESPVLFARAPEESFSAAELRRDVERTGLRVVELPDAAALPRGPPPRPDLRGCVRLQRRAHEYFHQGALYGDWIGPASYLRLGPLVEKPELLQRELRKLGATHLLMSKSPGAVRPPGNANWQRWFRKVYDDPAAEVFELSRP